MFSPISSQVKVSLSIVIVAIEQLSVEPLSMDSAVVVAVPNSSNCTVMSWATIIGAILSSTMTLSDIEVVHPFAFV